jgi:hypothetical protein
MLEIESISADMTRTVLSHLVMTLVQDNVPLLILGDSNNKASAHPLGTILGACDFLHCRSKCQKNVLMH